MKIKSREKICKYFKGPTLQHHFHLINCVLNNKKILNTLNNLIYQTQLYIYLPILNVAVEMHEFYYYYYFIYIFLNFC